MKFPGSIYPGTQLQTFSRWKIGPLAPWPPKGVVLGPDIPAVAAKVKNCPHRPFFCLGIPMYCQPSSVPIVRSPVDNVGHVWATGRSVGRPLGRLFHQKVPSESSGGLRRAVRGDHGRWTLTFLPRLEKLNGYGSDHPLHLHHRKLLPEMNRRREICGRLLHQLFLLAY